MADVGYVPPLPRTDIPAPGENLLATLKLGVHTMRRGEYISDHDVKVANCVAHVLCGGKVTPGRRSASSICWIWSAKASSLSAAEKKTQERIAFTLEERKAAEELKGAAAIVSTANADCDAKRWTL